MADLITSARAKQAINQSTFTSAENTQIASLVSAASVAIENYCQRTFASTSYDEYLDGHDASGYFPSADAISQMLLLSNYPIISITSVTDNGTAVTDYTSLASRGILRRQGGWPEGYRRYRVQYTAGYATIPESVQEACAQWVAALYWQTKDNPASYPPLPTPTMALLLDPYKIVRITP